LTAWNQILSENEQETGVFTLSNYLEKSGYSLLTQAKILRLINANLLLSFSDSRGVEIAKECGVRIKDISEDSLNQIRTRLNQLITRQEIDSIKDESDGDTKTQSFETVMARAAIILKKDLPRDITVREWNAYSKEIKEMNHGRKG